MGPDVCNLESSDIILETTTAKQHVTSLTEINSNVVHAITVSQGHFVAYFEKSPHKNWSFLEFFCDFLPFRLKIPLIE